MSSAANESDISSCVGEPRVEDWFYCDSQGAIRFDNFFYSVVAVFQVITLEGWTDIMYTVDDATEFSVAWMFFVAIVLFVGMFVIQLLLAVITKAYSDEAQKERETNRAARQAQELEDLVSEVRDRLSEKNLLDDMDEAFKMFDLDSDGFIVVSEVRSSLTQLLGRSISRRTAARFVGLVDSDSDGKVSPDEFMVKIGARVEPPERGRLDTIKQSCQRSDSQQARFAGVRRVMEADAMSLLVLGLIAVNTVLLAMEYHDEELCDEWSRSMLARDEQSLEHMAEADLAYLEMVRTKSGLHHHTAGTPEPEPEPPKRGVACIRRMRSPNSRGMARSEARSAPPPAAAHTRLRRLHAHTRTHTRARVHASACAHARAQTCTRTRASTHK